MVKEYIHISDWIQFFIHIKTLLLTLVGVLISTLVIISGYLMINLKDLTELNKNTLVIFSILLVLILFYLTYAKSSPLKIATEILDLIMMGKLNDFKVIEELWFKRRKKMLTKIFEFIRTHWIEIIGLIITFIGIKLYYLLCEEKNFCDFGMMMISLGLGIIAIGIGISSDKKLLESQYIEFRRLRSQFEDIRLSLRERRLLLERTNEIDSNNVYENRKEKVQEFAIRYSFSIWKCKTYIDEINTIKHRLKGDDQSSIIRLLALYYLELLYGRIFYYKEIRIIFKISQEYKLQIQEMYDIVTKFDYYQKIKDEKLGKVLLEAKDMIIKDIRDEEKINKLEI